MTTFTITESARVNAPASQVYGMIADYNDGHKRIIPPKYFTSLEVEEGGVGAGTVIRFSMRVWGAERVARAQITEPQPGRVLMEKELTTGLVTTFTVAPAGDEASDVTIETVVPQSPGIRGAVERWVTKSMLPRIYRDELALLASQVE
ncbi:MAG TPA: SRPBCC family protein [Gemmatimonadaceae bacterium]|nr:SRPBCC family protein [Gemmatimonadaceae bacterium]